MHAPWLTIHELALALKVSIKTVRRAYLRGEIPVERIFQFVRFDLNEVKEAMRRNAQGQLDERLSPQGGRRAPGGASRRREAAPSPHLVKRGRKFQSRSRRSV